MSDGFKVFLSIILGLLVGWGWAGLITWSANSNGGDNGWDSFGILHILFIYASSPIVIWFSAKGFYKLLKKG